jgi:hypothetical protein
MLVRTGPEARAFKDAAPVFKPFAKAAWRAEKAAWRAEVEKARPTSVPIWPTLPRECLRACASIAVLR